MTSVDHILRYLAFRDYLSVHEEAREQYGVLKKPLPNSFHMISTGIWIVKKISSKGRDTPLWNGMRKSGESEYRGEHIYNA